MYTICQQLKNQAAWGRLAGSVGWESDFGSGRDLVVRGLEPRVGFCADTSEPGVRAWSLLRILCLPLSLALPHSHSVSQK